MITLANYIKQYCEDRITILEEEKDANLTIEEYVRVAIAKRQIDLLQDIKKLIDAYETVTTMEDLKSFDKTE